MKKYNAKFKFIFLSILCFGFFGWVNNSVAKNLYVNGSTGNDSYTWTQNDSSNPWATLTKASASAVAGDTVYVAAGTYSAPGANNESPPAFNPANSGTSESNRITFVAVGTAVLTLSSGNGSVYGATGRSYITWDGFTVNESDHAMRAGEPSLAVISDSSHHITIRNGVFLGSGFYGARDENRTAIWMSSTSNNHIHNNTFTNFSGSDENNSDIYMYDTQDTIVEHNRHSDGVGAFWAKGALGQGNANNIIRYNLISGMSRWGIRLGPSSSYSQVYQNIIYDSFAGIRNDSWPPTGLNVGRNNTYSNNTIVNSTYAYQLHNNNYPSDFRNNIASNIITSLAYSWSLTGPGTNTFDYNLYNAFPNAWTDDGGTARSFSYWQSTWGKDLNGSNTNPYFVNAAGHDYRLQASSPARTAGSTGGPVGAYITGNETIGLTSDTPGDTTPPAAPSGLNVT